MKMNEKKSRMRGERCRKGDEKTNAPLIFYHIRRKICERKMKSSCCVF